MDTNQEILNELRSMRRQSQLGALLGTFLVVILVAIAIAYLTWSHFERRRFLQAQSSSRPATPPKNAPQNTDESVLPDLDALLDRGDHQKALSNALGIVARQPNYHYAHANLGWVYVAMNDFTNAEAAYLRAVELFPSETHETVLAAIRKRLARDRGKEAPVK